MLGVPSLAAALEPLRLSLALAVLFAIGLGPALQLTSGRGRRLDAALLAPALGLALLGFVLHPLVLAGVPVARAATGVNAVLLAASALLAWTDRRRTGSPTPGERRDLVAAVAAVVVLVIAVCVPLQRGGLDHRLWQLNEWDASNYIQLASYVQEIPVAAAAQTAGEQQVVQRDPAASTVIALVRGGMRLATSVALAWMAELLRRPVYECYALFKLLNLVLTLPAALALGRRLGLGRVACLEFGAVTAAGFWTVHTADVDAASQANAVPLTLLLVYAWVQTEADPLPRPVGRERVLLGLAVAAIFCYYGELIPLLVAAFLMEWLLTPRDRRVPDLWRQGATALVAAAVLAPALTTHVEYLRRASSGAFARPRAGWEQAFYPFLFEQERVSLAGLWGLSLWREAAGGRAGRAAVLLVAIALTAVLAIGVLRAVRRPRAPVPRILAELVLVFWGAGLVLWLRGDLWLSGKAFSYGAPFAAATLFVAIASGSGGWRVGGALLAAAWAASQAATLAWRAPATASGAPPLPRYVRLHTDGIDEVRQVGAIGLAGLGADFGSAPDSLRRAWMTVLSRQPGFLPLHGLSRLPGTPPVMWIDSGELPRWMLVTRARDPFAALGLGRLVSSTPLLALYEMTPDDFDAAITRVDPLRPAQGSPFVLRAIACDGEGTAASRCVAPQGLAGVRFLASGTRALALRVMVRPTAAGRWRVLVNGALVLDEEAAGAEKRIAFLPRRGTNWIHLWLPAPTALDGLRLELAPER